MNYQRSPVEVCEAPELMEVGRSRVVIEEASPQIDGGRYPIKRTVGERVVVEASLFADGHDKLSAVVKYRPEKTPEWSQAEMTQVANDRWRGEFVVATPGVYLFTIEAWVDRFKSWRDDLRKKAGAKQNISVEIIEGARLIQEAAQRATSLESEWLAEWAKELASGQSLSGSSLMNRALDENLGNLAIRFSDRRFATTYEPELSVVVDPEYARFSAWYEMFPRSCAAERGQHGTFRDCEAQLPRIAAMGFDILYFPPIHPIGKSFRKGKNNNPACQEDEPGSPWAIGSSEGGHKSIHPQLGTLDDFRRLVEAARAQNLSIALDIALQCSPDHPYVTEHSGWFRKRPDGSVQYAENPPKKYQDIYPFDFECDDWRGLWMELKSIFDFWIAQGVVMFRVDNPHTKSFAFWEWCLTEIKREHPEVIFLAEAFTRPTVLYRLAKLGFTQSYNYFPWRNGKEELVEFMRELTQSPVKDFFRPVLWPNTPDILTQYLQVGGKPAFEVRLMLAATLGASYGIYGPAFELCDNAPIQPGSEEYLNAEKYEIRHWDLNASQSLQDLITRVNRIRHENPALQSNDRLEFHPVDNDNLIAYTKTTEDGTDTVLTVVNLDPHHTQSGWISLHLAEFLPDLRAAYQMHDLLTGARFLWKGARNYVELNPQYSPAHIFRLRQFVRTEREFDYFM
jgi:starch synthase (maltosyl-transferring)